MERRLKDFASEVAVCPAESSDARRIAEIHVNAWREAYKDLIPVDVLARLSVDDRETSWLKQLGDESQTTLASFCDGEINGWTSFGPSRDKDSDPVTAEVYAIYLDPKTWRRGIGRLLWEHAVADLHSQGFRRFTVLVLEENAGARAFYEAMHGAVDDIQPQQIVIGGKTLFEIRYSFDCTDSGIVASA